MIVRQVRQGGVKTGHAKDLISESSGIWTLLTCCWQKRRWRLRMHAIAKWAHRICHMTNLLMLSIVRQGWWNLVGLHIVWWRRHETRHNDSLQRLTWICTIEAYWDRERLGPWKMPEMTGWCQEARYGWVCLQHGDRTGWRRGQSWRPVQAGPLWAQQAHRHLGGMRSSNSRPATTFNLMFRGEDSTVLTSPKSPVNQRHRPKELQGVTHKK